MEAINKNGLQRFNERFPHYNRCNWNSIAESEGPSVEGRLRDCLKCSGTKYECDNYVVARR